MTEEKQTISYRYYRWVKRKYDLLRVVWHILKVQYRTDNEDEKRK